MTNRGRAPKRTATEQALVEDAAMTLAVAGNNRMLCKELGQNLTPPPFNLEDLPSHSLPNPCLALMIPERLQENFGLIDKQFARGPSSPTQRLVCAMDATYLLKAMQQMKVRGRAGLVGGCWAPSNEEHGFIPLDDIPPSVPYAPIMTEFLLWDPNARGARKPFSVASMPMGLAPPKEAQATKTHAGNIESWISMGYECMNSIE